MVQRRIIVVVRYGTVVPYRKTLGTSLSWSFALYKLENSSTSSIANCNHAISIKPINIEGTLCLQPNDAD